jgi:hypothetical protein
MLRRRNTLFMSGVGSFLFHGESVIIQDSRLLVPGFMVYNPLFWESQESWARQKGSVIFTHEIRETATKLQN